MEKGAGALNFLRKIESQVWYRAIRETHLIREIISQGVRRVEQGPFFVLAIAASSFLFVFLSFLFFISLFLSLSLSLSLFKAHAWDREGVRTRSRSRADIIEKAAPVCVHIGKGGLTWSRTTVARGPSFFPLNFFYASLWAASLSFHG